MPLVKYEAIKSYKNSISDETIWNDFKLANNITHVYDYFIINDIENNRKTLYKISKDVHITPITTNSMYGISYVICDIFNLSIDEFTSKNRERKLVIPRQFFYFFCKKILLKISLNKIGEHAGGYNHATVLHGIKTINNLIKTNKEIRGIHDIIANRFNFNSK